MLYYIMLMRLDALSTRCTLYRPIQHKTSPVPYALGRGESGLLRDEGSSAPKAVLLFRGVRRADAGGRDEGEADRRHRENLDSV